MEFKQRIIEKFNYIYTREEDEEITDSATFIGISAEQAFAEEFGWYPLLMIAADNAFLNVAEVTKTPAMEFLTYINFYKRKVQLENDRIQRMQNTPKQ